MALHVLVIDPDDRTRESLRASLAAMGLSVATAKSGEDGLASARLKAPNLVILEVVMPRMDGVECMLALKRLYPRAKYVAVTAAFGMFSAEFLLRVMERLGAVSGLMKPVSRRELARAVRAAMEVLTP